MIKKSMVAVLAACALLVSPVMADLTSIGPSLFSGEKDHKAILGDLYGGTFTASSPHFTNGTVTATRINDIPLNSPASDFDLHATSFTGLADQIWTDGSTNLSIRAVYAGFNQAFGYVAVDDFDNLTGGYQPLLDEKGPLNNTHTFAPGSRWVWSRLGSDADGETYYSLNSANPDAPGYDHMVTYSISGLANQTKPVWLLFWEDTRNGYVDSDFNDLVVEVRVVPAPGAASLALLGLPIVGWVKRRLA